MERFARALRAGVAQRIVWLFVASAVLPVAAMAGISFRAVNGQLEEHSEERLTQLARNAGQSILQQVRLAERDLRVARSALAGDRPAALDSAALPPAFLALSTTGPDGVSQHVVGSGRTAPPLTPDETDRLSRDQLVLRGYPDRVLQVVLPLRAGVPAAGTVTAELRGDSIWSAAEIFVTLPSVVDFCVLAAGRPLYCSSGAERLPTAFGAEQRGALSGTYSVDSDVGSLIAGYWSFYPDRAFDAPPWSVVVAETAAAVYAPLAGFSTTFALALLLALLLVVLLSSVQIRRTLEPLRALQAGTQRIAAGDLATRVDVAGDDEFGVLAHSFNAMATRLASQFTQFQAMQAVGQAALGDFDRDAVLVTALAELPSVSHCRSAAVLLAPSVGDGEAELFWLTGPRTLGGTGVELTGADRAWLAANPRYAAEPGTPVTFFASARKGLGGGTLVAFPHVVKGVVHGATLLEMPDGSTALAEETAGRIRQIADQVAVALDDVRLVDELEKLSWGALVAFARAIDAKSRWTGGHSERVTEMALAIAREMGFGPDDLDVLHRGGLLHDIGKIGVPNAILDKELKLTDPELETIRQHPEIGHRILYPIGAFAPALPLVLQHHENWDGSGYPHGIAGDEIHPLSRVLSVADAFDAMASARPYRPGRSESSVLGEIVRASGTQFEPRVVDALVRLMADRGTLAALEAVETASSQPDR